MPGERYVDVFAGPTALGPKNSVRIEADTNGLLWKSVQGGPLMPLDGGWPMVDSLWKAQTLAIAQDRARRYVAPLYVAGGVDPGKARLMATGYFGRSTGSDLEDAEFTTTSGFGFSNPAAQDTAFSGGVYSLNNAMIGLNNKLPIITHPRGEPWFARGRFRFPGTQFSGAGTELISVVNAANSHGIQFLNNGSTTQMSLFLFDGTGNSGFISCGPDGVLGSTNCPNNAWVPVSLFFLPGVGLGWEFSDVVNPSNFLTQAQLDHLFDEPAVVLSGSIDPMQYRIDALAVAYQMAL